MYMVKLEDDQSTWTAYCVLMYTHEFTHELNIFVYIIKWLHHVIYKLFVFHILFCKEYLLEVLRLLDKEYDMTYPIFRWKEKKTRQILLLLNCNGCDMILYFVIISDTCDKGKEGKQKLRAESKCFLAYKMLSKSQEINRVV